MSNFRSFVHKDNIDILGKLRELKDEKGNPLLKPSVWAIVEYIARFGRDKGCFVVPETLADQTGLKAKTIKRNLKYLVAQGIVQKTFITIKGRKRSSRILQVPKKAVESVVGYRKRTGEYKYGDNLSPYFFETKGDNLGKMGGQFGTPEGTISTPEVKEVIKEDKKEPTYYPPLPESSQRDDFWDCLKRAERRPADAKRVGCADPDTRAGALATQDDVSHSERNPERQAEMANEAPEPLRSKKGKKNKTQKERRAEAIQKHNRGHIVNPLGGPNNSARRVLWRRARPIGPQGAVTVSQLMKHLCETWQDSIGTSPEDQLPVDKYALQAWFDRLRQNFVDLCGYNPSYRELAEYFTWILEPRRFKNPQQLATLKVQQIQGKVYVQQFYNTVLLKRDTDKSATENPHVQKHGQSLELLNKAFKRIEDSLGHNSTTVFAMVRYGYVVFAQFLHERKGISGNQCRKRIIETMAEFLEGYEQRSDGLKFFEDALKNTKELSYLYDKYFVWDKWQEQCVGLVEEAIKLIEAKDGEEKI